jgi:REP element-mobilizing transposase RayT
MIATPYNLALHHRHSIRLQGHDYAGGGMYFVTICAHRDFITASGGNPFGVAVGARSFSPPLGNGATRGATQVSTQGATQVSPVRVLIEERMRITAELCPYIRWEEAVIMPDHFHALIRLEGGHARRGDVVGGFKAAVSRELRRMRGDTGGDTGVARTAPQMRIWHRNYYEMIVRDEEAERNIRAYIRMNPWRCVTEFGNGLRGMGNPALWNAEKLGVLCSRNAPKPAGIPKASAYLSGFHSPMEQEILQKLLEYKKPVIWCPAWGLGGTQSPETLAALEENRMLILEMTARDGDLASAEARNRFVLEQADRLWLPHVTPGGMLDRLVKAATASSPNFKNKLLNQGFSDAQERK